MRVCESEEFAYFDFIINFWYYMAQFISKYNNFYNRAPTQTMEKNRIVVLIKIFVCLLVVPVKLKKKMTAFNFEISNHPFKQITFNKWFFFLENMDELSSTDWAVDWTSLKFCYSV